VTRSVVFINRAPRRPTSHVARWTRSKPKEARRLPSKRPGKLVDGLRGLAERLDRHQEPIRGAIESMPGARFVHDTLEELGWDVLIADAEKVKPFGSVA
jgi:transposase